LNIADAPPPSLNILEETAEDVASSCSF